MRGFLRGALGRPPVRFKTADLPRSPLLLRLALGQLERVAHDDLGDAKPRHAEIVNVERVEFPSLDDDAPDHQAPNGECDDREGTDRDGTDGGGGGDHGYVAEGQTGRTSTVFQLILRRARIHPLG